MITNPSIDCGVSSPIPDRLF